MQTNSTAPALPAFTDLGHRFVVFHDGTAGAPMVTKQAANIETRGLAEQAAKWLLECGCQGVQIFNRPTRTSDMNITTETLDAAILAALAQCSTGLETEDEDEQDPDTTWAGVCDGDDEP